MLWLPPSVQNGCSVSCNGDVSKPVVSAHQLNVIYLGKETLKQNHTQDPELRRLLLSYSASTNEDSGSSPLCSSYSLNVLLFPHQQNFGDPHDDHICSGVWRTRSSVSQREFQEWDLVSPQTAAGCSWLLVLDVKNWHSGFAPHRARINLKQIWSIYFKVPCNVF